MKLIILLLVIIVISATALSATYEPARETYDAKTFTTFDKLLIKGSRRGTINVPTPTDDDPNDFVKLTRLDLVGDSYDRGYAHGFLLAEDIVIFTGPQLTKYFADELLYIDISGAPEELQQILKVLQVAGAIVAPKVFKEAMAWVWEQEKEYVPQYINDEILGIATGVCAKLSLVPIPENSTVTPQPCDVNAWVEKIQGLNMLPELIRMACTSFGAWGKAVATPGTLIQVRALDFGGGPFANHTVVQVNRKIPGQEANDFVSITFPAFVGAITGISQSGVGISEKVWMKYGTVSLLPGHYDGLADVFVLRHILEKSKTRSEAEDFLQEVKRTFAIWIGIGDYATKTMSLNAYNENSSTPLDDTTVGAYTGQPYIENVVYVDKHPQPSGEGPTGTLPTALKDFWGQIDLENAKTVVKHHGTGDLHVAAYDYGANQMYLALGRINHKGEYGPTDADSSSWKAYRRPWLKFNLADLWAGK